MLVARPTAVVFCFFRWGSGEGGRGLKKPATNFQKPVNPEPQTPKTPVGISKVRLFSTQPQATLSISKQPKEPSATLNNSQFSVGVEGFSGWVLGFGVLEFRA